MKIEIWNESHKPEPEPLRLRLVRECGMITLAAVDAYGERLARGYILHINDDGYLVRRMDCKAPGLQLDDSGRIKVKP